MYTALISGWSPSRREVFLRVDVLGVEVDDVDMPKAVERVLSFVETRAGAAVFTPNAEMVMASRKIPQLKNALLEADLVIPDGAGVVLGSKILGSPLKCKVAGVDLVTNLVSSNRPLSLFLYGSAPGVAEKAAEEMKRMNPEIRICGTMHGYHEKDLEPAIVDRICSTSPDIVLVALGVPAQELWISRNRKKLDMGACIGCGGTLDIFAGTAKRAPEKYIRWNLEWLYRLMKQPRRIVRMLRIPVFMALCLFKRLSGRS
jgi:N-acetylglucosaminyldiphosphoundecaprenol N-acetyl-beta-D-mannosaminyltransferase